MGKSALTQTFHSDGTHFPKNYTMVSFLYSFCYKRIMIRQKGFIHDDISLKLYVSSGVIWSCENLITCTSL